MIRIQTRSQVRGVVARIPWPALVLAAASVAIAAAVASHAATNAQPFAALLRLLALPPLAWLVVGLAARRQRWVPAGVAGVAVVVGLGVLARSSAGAHAAIDAAAAVYGAGLLTSLELGAWAVDRATPGARGRTREWRRAGWIAAVGGGGLALAAALLVVAALGPGVGIAGVVAGVIGLTGALTVAVWLGARADPP